MLQALPPPCLPDVGTRPLPKLSRPAALASWRVGQEAPAPVHSPEKIKLTCS